MDSFDAQFIKLVEDECEKLFQSYQAKIREGTSQLTETSTKRTSNTANLKSEIKKRVKQENDNQ